MNSKEKTIEEDTKEKDKKEQLKNIWKRLNQKWLWVNIGSYIVGTVIFWCLFFFEIINLMTVTFLTILNIVIIPLMYYFFKYVRGSKHQKLITKIILVGCGGYAFGFFLWLFLGYVLVTSPWAPLRVLDAVLRGRINLLILISSWAIGAYVMYRIGKKREWRPPSHLIN
jgi:predicted RND superfamily exporter protein